MTEGREGRALWSDERTRAIDGRGIRAKDMLDAKKLKITGRRKKRDR